ncbi:MbnH family di-heme enzyme [Teredinibacter turnerae]|uniref:MbnH family di-heme enzyme n=1 Tax=Teredinibacter turnerae TaxID=2426 RepID=UPI0030CFFDF4
MSIKTYCALIFGALILAACGGESYTEVEITEQERSYRQLLGVPDHFSLPHIPEFNPPTKEKIDLGHFLFYDKQLSANQTQSCASCHVQELAFTDGLARPFGSTGDRLTRNSQGLGNAAYHATFTWSNDGFLNLEDQLAVPIRSDNPVELGVTEAKVDEVLARFDADPVYRKKFAAAYPEAESGATVTKIIYALASFCRTLISGSSPYDNYLLGDDSALTDQQKWGLQLFNGEKFECFHCHSGLNFSVSYRDNNSDPATQTFPFFNNGLYNVDGTGSYPQEDQGLYDLTQKLQHRGLFRPQSLRNVAVTAPYMHDGSIDTLREVLEHYARGGRKVETGIYQGDGRLSPLKSGLVRGFAATDDELDAVEAFLESLTDDAFISDPAFANPFE